MDDTSRKAEEQRAEDLLKQVRVEIKDELPPERAVYADQMFVNHSEHDFVIRFCRLDRPVVRDEKELQQLKTAVSNVVAKVIVPPTLMPGIIRAFSENWETYRRTHGKGTASLMLAEEEQP